MKCLRLAFLVVVLVVWVLPVHAEAGLQVKGESLTPAGTTVSLVWQVREENNRYRFYLDKQMKAEMVLQGGEVVKIRRRVRLQGKVKWFVLTDPTQIRLELKSGFYPFVAVLNYRKKGIEETIMETGRFEVVRSEIR
jgi:hypothetical protein